MNYEIRQIPAEQTKDWLLNKHYAHRMPVISYAFGLYDNNNDLQGVCTFGMPCCQMTDGNCIFNNTNYKEEKGEFKVKTLELNRLVINENLPKNTLSFFVSQCIKLLPKPMCLVSFADPTNGHHGYIYQATNWIYTGTGELGGKSVNFILNGKDYHGKSITELQMKKMGMKYNISKTLKQNWVDNGGIIKEQERKHRYFMFLGNKKQKTEMKMKLKYPILPYPKGDNKRYDASYQPKINKTLF